MVIDVECGKAITVGEPDQVALQIVAPSVIWAGKATAILDAIAECHASMGAGIEERMQLPVLMTGDHYRHSGDVTGDDVAGFGKVARPSDHLRRSPKENFPLKLEAVGIGEDRPVTDKRRTPKVGRVGQDVGDHPASDLDHLPRRRGRGDVGVLHPGGHRRSRTNPLRRAPVSVPSTNVPFRIDGSATLYSLSAPVGAVVLGRGRPRRWRFLKTE